MSVTIGQGCVAESLSGSVADGKKLFKKCKSCHSIISDDGVAIEKGGKLHSINISVTLSLRDLVV